MILGLLLACHTPTPSGMSVDEVQAYVRSGTPQPEAWASAVHSALGVAGQPLDADHVCQVLAVIEQESGYDADPAVPGLGAMARQELETELRKELGFLGDDVLDVVLDQTAANASQTFAQRLAAVKTERDLDRFTQDLIAHHEAKAPLIGKGLRLLFPRMAERLNPVTTVGSMQVKVDFAQNHPSSRGRRREEVREALYTLDGGVHYGTLRLFDHDAAYERALYRFADYNAGQFASRNAAFQDQVAKLTGHALTPDGDLLMYNDKGRPRGEQSGETVAAVRQFATAAGLDPDRAERDLLLEKTRAFESTALWTAVKEAYAPHGSPVYARVPDVALDSPKLHGQWSTSTFAERVDKRYRDCLARR